MKHSVTVNFQSAPAGQRPTDESLNRSEIYTDNLGNIPLEGDYVCFDNENEEEIVFKVKTRLFEYKYIDKTDDWSIFANIVVERQPEEIYNKLIKM